MALTKADLKDAAQLLKAGRIDATRNILSSSNDPRAVALLAKLDARFPPQSGAAPQPNDDLSEIKRLIAQKKYNQAEKLLRVSDHPKASYLLHRIALKKSALETPETTTSRLPVLKPLTVMLDLFGRKSRQLVMSRPFSRRS